MTTKELIELYRQCERQAWGDNPVTFDYFIDWLETEQINSEERP